MRDVICYCRCAIPGSITPIDEALSRDNGDKSRKRGNFVANNIIFGLLMATSLPL